MNLTNDSERRALALAEQALELTDEQRTALLAAPDVPEAVRARARVLIDSSKTGVFTTAQLPWQTLPPTAQPQVAGSYAIQRQIGEGGMGSVYLAHRSDGAFDREVAIKILHPNANRVAFSGRFEAERQILANLHHPNIAQLLDGGYLENGSPYLVMELIDGTSIDRYVDEQQLNVRQILKLFLKVCSAVEAAHQNLVVHRDIKPANILVDTQGEPKLLDFGIAKSLAPEDAGLTRTNAPSAMTLDYASPEQLLRQSITTSTDVYGLGVLLYQLLSGTRPFTSEGRTFGEIEKQILEQAPAPLTSVAGARLRAQISNDLELIVLCAMAKDPKRRYASVAALHEEIGRYLTGAAIAARGDSTAYRLRKLLRRHWLGFTTAAAIAVATLGALFVSINQTRIAQDAAQRAQATSEFLSKILLSPSSRADSPLGLGSDAKISVLLAAAQAELTGPSGDRAFGTAVVARAELMVTLAQTYHGLAMYEQARDLLNQANALCAAASCQSTQLQHRMAYHTGQALVMLGEPNAALKQLSDVEQQVAIAGDEQLLLANILNEKASALWSLGHIEDTVLTMERAVTLYRQHGKDQTLVAVAYTRLGSLYSNLGRLEEGLDKLEEAATIYQTATTRALPELADLYNEIGIIHWKRGNRDAFRDNLFKAWEIVKAIDGVSEIEIRILTNLGSEYVNQGEGRPWLERSRVALAEFASDQHETRAWVDMLEGRILAHEQQYSEAIAAFRKALATYEALMPAYNDSHAGAEMAIGSTFAKLGQNAKALPYNQRVYDYFKEIYASEDTEYLRRARERVNDDRAALGMPTIAM